MKHPSKILKELDFFASKSLGQNFLTSQSSLIQLKPYIPIDLPLLEIGPGLGQISNWVLAFNKNLSVCEKDKRLAEYLSNNFENLHIFNEDFLKIENPKLQEKNIQFIFGNLPFYITSPIILKIILEMKFIKSALFGIQKEMAMRCIAEKGNSLGVLMQSLGYTKVVAKMSKNNFFPIPKVDAVWIYWQRDEKINLTSTSLSNLTLMDVFQVLLRGIFWGKRKNLQTTLMKNPFFEKNTITSHWKTKIKAISQEEQYASFFNRKADSFDYKEIIYLFKLLMKI